MPRPGPRPYECVKRAWHSERHQPIRGSLIQEIFRVVNEIHCSQTKKNKEWQEKLPVVVLKAEEIIYSKANSEAEYMDLQTLWERTNDAINTIIRREESTETGDLLQPCIEAALFLGCTARKASRSQRNSNPRSYLTPSTQEPAPIPPRVPDNVIHVGSSRLVPLHSSKPTSTPRNTPYYSTTTRPITMNSTQLRLESGSIHTRDHNPSMSHVFPFSSQNLPPPPSNQVYPLEIHSENLVRVYPLYYGPHHQTTDPQVVFQPPHGASFSPSVLGMSQAQRDRKPNEKSFLQNFFTCDGVVSASSRNTEADLRSTAENPSVIACDLSLRLAPLSAPSASTDSRCTHEVEDIVSSSSQDGSKSRDPSPRTSKELCFFPRENADDPLESSLSKRRSKGKDVEDFDGSDRKQKASVSNFVDAEQLSYHPNFSHGLFFGRMKEPDK